MGKIFLLAMMLREEKVAVAVLFRVFLGGVDVVFLSLMSLHGVGFC